MSTVAAPPAAGRTLEQIARQILNLLEVDGIAERVGPELWRLTEQAEREHGAVFRLLPEFDVEAA